MSYYDDPDFRRAIDREIARACQETMRGEWITYAIHDPTRPDTVGGFDSLLIYVGNTNEFDVRVGKRLRLPATAVRRPTKWIEGVLYEVMARGGVPRFRVIDRMPDAVDSFVSVTNWARRYIVAGYPIENKWAEETLAGPPMTRATVPQYWLWRLAVEDALEAGVSLIRLDEATGRETALDLGAWPRKHSLIAIRRELAEQFAQNGQQATLRVFVR